jgi:SAM-dependent methyltransferase
MIDHESIPPLTPAWERTRNTDDGRPLSFVAWALLKVGRLIKSKRGDQLTVDPPHEDFEAKYASFFDNFPNLRKPTALTIVEIGGGCGELSRYLANLGAKLYCVELNPIWATKAREYCDGANVQILQTSGATTGVDANSIDRVILHDVIEHIADPLSVLIEAIRILKPGGELLVSFYPWGAAYGGHTWAFLPIPWAHLFYSKKVLAEMRASKSNWHTTDLGATGLYKVTVGNFEKMASNAHFNIRSIQLQGVKGQQWLTKIPGLRELGTSIVTARLSK